MIRNHRTEELRSALRRLQRRVLVNHGGLSRRPAPGRQTPQNVIMEPRTPFEALLQQQMQTLEKQLQDLRGRVNGIFILIVGTVALQAVLRVAGV